jgi:hypothetical protein
MKLYTFYSDTHTELYEDYFLKSFNDYGLNKSFELDSTLTRQHEGNGAFDSEGFNSTMMDKVGILQRAAEENINEYFIFSDCDVQFFGDFKEDILSYTNGGADMIAQSDQGTICAGFFIAKGGEKLKSFFDLIHKKTPLVHNDQIAINKYRFKINSSLLPSDKYFNISSASNGALWEEGRAYNLPKNMLMHHANFVIGVEKKIKMMNYVRENKDN